MKLKLAVLDNDTDYLYRLVGALNTKYSEETEIYSFTDPGVAVRTVASLGIDALVASDSVEGFEPDSVKSECAFAYLISDSDETEYNNCPAICRYQRASVIYEKILLLLESFRSGSGEAEAARTFVFASFGGGCGNSTVSAALCTSLAAKGARVFYLNLEDFGGAEDYFPVFGQNGQYTLSDAANVIRSNSDNKAETIADFVYFSENRVGLFKRALNPADATLLSADELYELINIVAGSFGFDYVVADMPASRLADKRLLCFAAKIVLVSDGTPISNGKMIRVLNAAASLGGEDGIPFTAKIGIAYNRYDLSFGRKITGPALNELGVVGVLEHMTTERMILRLSETELMDNILQDYQGGNRNVAF